MKSTLGANQFSIESILKRFYVISFVNVRHKRVEQEAKGFFSFLGNKCERSHNGELIPFLFSLLFGKSSTFLYLRLGSINRSGVELPFAVVRFSFH